MVDLGVCHLKQVSFCASVSFSASGNGHRLEPSRSAFLFFFLKKSLRGQEWGAGGQWGAKGNIGSTSTIKTFKKSVSRLHFLWFVSICAAYNTGLTQCREEVRTVDMSKMGKPEG